MLVTGVRSSWAMLPVISCFRRRVFSCRVMSLNTTSKLFVVENVHAQQELPALVLKRAFRNTVLQTRTRGNVGRVRIRRASGGRVVAYHYVADGIHVLQEQAVVEFHRAVRSKEAYPPRPNCVRAGAVFRVRERVSVHSRFAFVAAGYALAYLPELVVGKCAVPRSASASSAVGGSRGAV